MIDKIKILVVLGTAREGRMSERVSKAIMDETGKRNDLTATLIDVRDFNLSATVPAWVQDKRTDKWKRAVAETDGLFIVSPEYNHSFPGELKILLDSAFGEYLRKPVALCGVSNGNFAGTRMVETLRSLVAYLGMITVPTNVLVANVDKSFSEKGETKDSAFYERVNKALDEIALYSKLLRSKK